MGLDELIRDLINGFVIFGLIIVGFVVLLCFEYIFNHENKANPKNPSQDGPNDDSDSTSR